MTTPLFAVFLTLAIVHLVIQITTALVAPLSKPALIVIVVLTLLLLGFFGWSGHWYVGGAR